MGRTNFGEDPNEGNTVKVYVERQYPVEAMVWTGDNMKHLKAWGVKYHQDPYMKEFSILAVENFKRQDQHANEGDYIIKVQKKPYEQFEVMSEQVFYDKYEEDK